MYGLSKRIISNSSTTLTPIITTTSPYLLSITISSVYPSSYLHHLQPPFSIPVRTFAGHSKWAKIARSKGANDAQRSVIFSKLARQITAAVKAGGGDPSSNLRLAAVLHDCKKNHVPRDVVERALKSKSDVIMEQVTFEGTGPGGIAFIIDCLTDNRKRTVPEIRSLLTKSGGELGTTNSQNWQFKTQGTIIIQLLPAPNTTLTPIQLTSWEEKVMDTALTAGALDVSYESEMNDEGKEIPEQGYYATIICNKDDLITIRQTLEKEKYTISSAENTRVPLNTIDIVPDSDIGQAFQTLVEQLDNHEDVTNFIHNGILQE